MKTHIIETFDTDPWRNLAIEETIMETTEPDEISLYLWQNENTVVIGRNQNAWQECRCSLLESDGCRLARRRTGGGAVFHDIGNLNFTFAVSPELYDVKRQNSVIIAACGALGVDAEFTGRNDMTVDGRKFSGCAYLKTQKSYMHHGTILISADMKKMGRYLAPSDEKLHSKGVESVRARVTNLAEFIPDITVEMVRKELCRAFEGIYGTADITTEEDYPAAMIDEIYRRNSSWEWNYGKTPQFDAELKKRFEWGGVQILLAIHNGFTTSIKVYTDSMDPHLAERIETAFAGKHYGTELAEAAEEISHGDIQLEDIALWLKSAL